MAYLSLEERMGVSRDDHIAVHAMLVGLTEATRLTDELIANLRSRPSESLVMSREFIALLELVSEDGAEIARIYIPKEEERQAIRRRLATQDPRLAAELRRRGDT